MDQTERRERAERLQTIAIEMDSIVKDVGPRLIRLAHLREEARSIIREIDERPGQ